MSSILKQIVKQAPHYFSAGFIGAISSMLMTKYYTKTLTPEDFGVVALYLALQQYLVPLIGLNFDNAAHRVFFDIQEDERPALHGTAFLCIAGVFSMVTLIFLAFGPAIVTQIKGNPTYLVFLLLSVLAAGATNYFTKEAMNYRKPHFILRQVLLMTVLTHGVAVGLIYFFNAGGLARLVGLSAGGAASACFLYYLLVTRTEFRIRLTWRSDHLRRMSYYALPSLVGIGVGAALQQADRFLINHHLGAQKVGAYAVGLMIGQAFSLVTQAISQTIAPHILSTQKDNAEAMIRDAKRVDCILWPALFLAALGISLMGDTLIGLLADKRYIAGSRTLPFVIFSYALSGTYLTVSEVLNYHRVVWFWPIVSTVAFGIGAIVNFLAIPKYGVEGAAYALFCSNLIYSALIHLFARKHYLPLRFTVQFFLLVLLAGTLYLLRS